MKVLVDKDRLLTLRCGDQADTVEGERVRITHVDTERERVTVKFDRRRSEEVDAEFIGAEFQEVRSIEEQLEAAND
jgi:hypothetical protein